MTDFKGGPGVPEELIDRLGGLPREADPDRDLWPAIAAEIERDAESQPSSVGEVAGTRWHAGAPARPWIQAAAAVAIFALGGVGGWAITRTPPSASGGSIDQALVLAAEVQRTGTEYVAALAAFVAVVDSLSGDARMQGRNAAIATLYGASRELVALEGARADVDGRPIEPTPIRF